MASEAIGSTYRRHSPYGDQGLPHTDPQHSTTIPHPSLSSRVPNTNMLESLYY